MIIANVDFINFDVTLGSKNIVAPALFQSFEYKLNCSNGFMLELHSALPLAYSANTKLSSVSSISHNYEYMVQFFHLSSLPF